jgi:uncharacterized membrane protein YfcA
MERVQQFLVSLLVATVVGLVCWAAGAPDVLVVALGVVVGSAAGAEWATRHRRRIADDI